MQATLFLALSGFALAAAQSCVQQLQARQQCTQPLKQQLKAQKDQVISGCMGAPCQQQLASVSMCKQQMQSEIAALQSCSSTGLRNKRSNELFGDYDDYIMPGNNIFPGNGGNNIIPGNNIFPGNGGNNIIPGSNIIAPPIPNPNGQFRAAQQYNPPQQRTAPQYNVPQQRTAPQNNSQQQRTAPQYNYRGRRDGGFGGDHDSDSSTPACRPMSSTQQTCIMTGLQNLQTTTSSIRQQLLACNTNNPITACQQQLPSDTVCNCLCTAEQAQKQAYTQCLSNAGVTVIQKQGKLCNQGCRGKRGYDID